MLKRIFLFVYLAIFVFVNTNLMGQTSSMENQITEALKETEIARAKAFLRSVPITVTDASCVRSAGGKHDFYSEGDYWWPDPENPGGKYIRRDGQTNPDNFTAHRHAMVRLSEIVATLSSAWLLTEESVYAQKAIEHLNAWFVDTATLMNPNMLYAQAIWGRHTGRGIGLIDAYHFVEVAQSVKMLEDKGAISQQQAKPIKKWFAGFLNWMITHPYGIDEMNTKNNHAVCWLATASSMAVLTQNKQVIELCTTRFKNIALPDQMDSNGSFPQELGRTKPYGYSLFNIDAFCNVAQILKGAGVDLFAYRTKDGRSLEKGLDFIFPYVKDKNKWPYEKDIYIWEAWPVCHPALLFCALAYDNPEYLETYLQLPLYPVHDEVIRNLPVRHPLIWIMN